MIEVFQNIFNMYSNESITTVTIISVLLVVLFLAVYEFLVYRFVSHRSFYNKSFNITIAILPFFISTIILCLQSNIIITLGTIGALVGAVISTGAFYIYTKTNTNNNVTNVNEANNFPGEMPPGMNDGGQPPEKPNNDDSSKNEKSTDKKNKKSHSKSKTNESTETS